MFETTGNSGIVAQFIVRRMNFEIVLGFNFSLVF